MSLIDPTAASGAAGWHLPSRRQPGRRFTDDSQGFVPLPDPDDEPSGLRVIFAPLTALPSLLEPETAAVPDATPLGLRVSFYAEHLSHLDQRLLAGTRLDAIA